MVSVSSTVPVCAFHGNGDVETPRRNLEGPVLRSGRSAEENGGNIIIWIEVIVESLVGRDRLCYGGGGGVALLPGSPDDNGAFGVPVGALE